MSVFVVEVIHQDGKTTQAITFDRMEADRMVEYLATYGYCVHGWEM